MPTETSSKNKRGETGKPNRKAKATQGPPSMPERSMMRRLWRGAPGFVLAGVFLLLFVNREVGIIKGFTFPDFLASDKETQPQSSSEAMDYSGLYNTEAPLADFFEPTVLYWEEAILHWAQRFRLNPNIVAILMQVESCGDPYAESEADAQGLFQVIPYFHFDDKENQMNPETNAQAGLTHMLDCLARADGYGEEQLGLAFACYNAGWSVIEADQAFWDTQAQSYYYWGTEMWKEVVAGTSQSETIALWLQRGGKRLCDDAAYWQEELSPIRDWYETVGYKVDSNEG